MVGGWFDINCFDLLRITLFRTFQASKNLVFLIQNGETLVSKILTIKLLELKMAQNSLLNIKKQ